MEKPTLNARTRNSVRTRQFAPGNSLAEYTGPWETRDVVHLLKRTMFGATIDDVNYFSGLSMSQAVDELMTPTSAPTTFPLNHYSSDGYSDPTGVLPWTTWIGTGIDFADDEMNRKRVESMQLWWTGELVNQPRSIHEKMTLFWHNHFASDAVARSSDTPAECWFNQYHKLRSNALGNFRTLIKTIALDPAMLIMLNGNTNKKTAPNENFGRELQELYTVGKGPDSKYTEADVRAAATVMTGHSVDASFNYVFNPGDHEDKNKNFSAFYGGTIITGRSGSTGASEVDDMLGMIFSGTEVSKWLCRKIYAFFIYYKIDASIESDIITPLATAFRNSNYDIPTVMSILLKSEHFYNLGYSAACIIKSPLDFIVGLTREYMVKFPDAADTGGSYTAWGMLNRQGVILQQAILNIPEVAGWFPYYQGPTYHELWINSVTYSNRNAYTDTMILTGDMMNMVSLIIDPLLFATKLANPSDPNQLIQESLDILYQVPLSAESQTYLKTTILLSGQTSDYYWTTAWNDYIANPANAVFKGTVLARLQTLYKYLMNLPEYHLS